MFQHHYYIYVRNETVYTDHKPLELLLTTCPKSPPRIQTLLMHLKLINIQWNIDQKLKIWQTYYHDPLCNKHLKKISRRAADSSHTQSSCSSFHQIIRHHHWIRKGWKDKGGNQIIENKPWNKSSSFYKTRNELTTSKNILLKPNYIVIPQHSNIKCLKLLKIQGINFEKKYDGQDYQQILNPLLNLVMLVKWLGHLRSYVNH